MTTDSVMNQTTSSDRKAAMMDNLSTTTVFTPVAPAATEEPMAHQINEDAIDTLNDLLEICRDGQFGFSECAAHTQSRDLKMVLMQRAEDCRRAGADLMKLIKQMGGEYEEGGTAMAALHRGWVAAKGKLTGYSDLDMLNECERAEDVALTHYRKALMHHLPEAVHALVKQQASGTQRNHDQIKALRNALKAAK